MSDTLALPPLDRELDRLGDFLARCRRLFVLTGAGVSTDSGIPDYRDAQGQWKHRRPVQFQDFVGHESVRRRYWARSLIGWPRVRAARPNTSHHTLARLEAGGHVHQLVTQNVDGLHQKAGSRRVIDLHGRLDRVECLDCRRSLPREDFQSELLARNPDFAAYDAPDAPDGDALLETVDFAAFRVPPCPFCRGLLKPRVVFFGETIPKARVRRSLERFGQADGLLVVGSSLMVFSGYRFCRAAAQQGTPMAAINLGRTRADDLLDIKLPAPCAPALEELLQRLGL